MLVFTRDANCQAWEINATRQRHDEDFRDLERQMLASVFPISLAALAANLLSFAVFARQKFDNPAIRLVLVSVSVWEVLLQSAVICEVAMSLSGAKHAHTKASYVATSAFRLVIGAAAFVRNWNMVVLSMSRCELVWRPLASRGRLFFSPRRLKACLASVVAVAFILSLLVQLEFMGVVCSNLADESMGDIVIRPFLASSDGDRPGYPSLVFYSLQCLLPPLIIPGPTIGMSLRLRRARRVSRRMRPTSATAATSASSGGGGGGNGGSLPRTQSGGRRARLFNTVEGEQLFGDTDNFGVASLSRDYSAEGRARRAAFLLASSTRSHRQNLQRQQQQQHQRTSVLVLALVLLFCVMESPTFLSTLCHFFFPHAPLLSRRFIFLANVLTVMDSLLNFFVYAAASASFRSEIRSALRCRRGWRHGPEASYCEQSLSLTAGTAELQRSSVQQQQLQHGASRTSSSGCSRISLRIRE